MRQLLKLPTMSTVLPGNTFTFLSIGTDSDAELVKHLLILGVISCNVMPSEHSKWCNEMCDFV